MFVVMKWFLLILSAVVCQTGYSDVSTKDAFGVRLGSSKGELDRALARTRYRVKLEEPEFLLQSDLITTYACLGSHGLADATYSEYMFFRGSLAVVATHFLSKVDCEKCTTCDFCGGDGIVTHKFTSRQKKCPHCSGTGERGGDLMRLCLECFGASEKTLNVAEKQRWLINGVQRKYQIPVLEPSDTHKNPNIFILNSHSPRKSNIIVHVRKSNDGGLSRVTLMVIDKEALADLFDLILSGTLADHEFYTVLRELNDVLNLFE